MRKGKNIVVRVIKKAMIIFINIVVWLITKFVKKNDKIIIIGSWMGEQYSDNSRFLFQYLLQNKKELGLKEVIWCTRSKKVYEELSKQGIFVIYGSSLRSFYWHIKSGIHIVCNAVSYNPNIEAQPDIDTMFSAGAKRVQLWHGIGMKAVGNLSNRYKNLSRIKKRIHSITWLNILMSPGFWADCYVLATSTFTAELMKNTFAIQSNKLIVSGYPRNCKCLYYLDDEKKIIDIINSREKTVLYLPTFREELENEIHPLSNERIREYIFDNHYLWIEKKHFADKRKTLTYDSYDGFIQLNKDFDINVILDHVSLLISDYSSVVFDMVKRKTPIMMFTPDYEQYKDGVSGFNINVKEKLGKFMFSSYEDLYKALKDFEEEKYMNEERKREINVLNEEYFITDKDDLGTIWQDIIGKLYEGE